MAKRKVSFAQSFTYKLYDPRRGITEVDGYLFTSNPHEYKANEERVFQNSMYTDCEQKQADIFHRMSVAEKECLKIQNEESPSSMRELRRTRKTIQSIMASMEEARSTLDIECVQMKKELKLENSKLKALPKGTAEYVQQAAKVSDKKHALNKLRRSCQDRIANYKKRLSVLIAKQNELEAEKQELLDLKTCELNSIREELCCIGSQKRQIILNEVGYALDAPGLIINLIEKDPDISDETANEIFRIMDGHQSKNCLWEVDSSDPRDGTLPLISSCVKDNIKQTMADLIVRVSQVRSCQFIDTMPVLLRLRKEGRLNYFRQHSDGTESIVSWEPRKSHSIHSESDEHCFD